MLHDTQIRMIYVSLNRHVFHIFCNDIKSDEDFQRRLDNIF